MHQRTLTNFVSQVVGGGSEEIMADLAMRQELMMAKAKLKL